MELALQQILFSYNLTYHSHQVSPSWGAAGVLDFCPVSSGVGEIAVLLNGDLKRCTVSLGCSSETVPTQQPLRPEHAWTEK